MATLNVPVPHPTIAAAIAAASPGDTIQLGAGYANEAATVTKNGLTITGGASNTGIVLTLDGVVTGVTPGGTAPIAVVGTAATSEQITGGAGDETFTFVSGATAAVTGRTPSTSAWGSTH